MRKFIGLTVLVFLFTLTITAQQGQRQGKERMHKKSDFTPEQMATLQSKKLTLHLDLNDNQQKEVYKLMKANVAERQQKMDEFKAKRQEGVKPTSEQKFQFENSRLDKQIAHKNAMKKILSEEQFDKWEKMMKSKMRQGKKKIGKFQKAPRDGKGQNLPRKNKN